jgi:hypothetical protein
MFPASDVVPNVSYSPIVGSILGRPAPLGLATMLWTSVPGGLWVCASRLDLTTCRLHVATSRLHVTFSRRGVRAVVTASTSGVRRLRTVIRARRLGGWRVGRGVRDYHSGNLTISKGDGSGLSGVCTGVGAGVRGGLRRHTGVHGLGDSDVRSSRWAIGRLGDVNSSGRRASAFNRSNGSVLSGLIWVGLGDGADRCARGGNSGDAVGDGRDVCGQHVSRGQRSTVVGLSTFSEDWRAVRHERSQSLCHREGACRVNDRGLVAGDKSSRGLCRLAAMFARSHSNDACGEASGGVSTAGVGHGAGCDRGVSCCSFRVVLGWGRVSRSSRIDMSCLITSRMRWLAV